MGKYILTLVGWKRQVLFSSKNILAAGDRLSEQEKHFLTLMWDFVCGVWVSWAAELFHNLLLYYFVAHFPLMPTIREVLVTVPLLSSFRSLCIPTVNRRSENRWEVFKFENRWEAFFPQGMMWGLVASAMLNFTYKGWWLLIMWGLFSVLYVSYK